MITKINLITSIKKQTMTNKISIITKFKLAEIMAIM